MAFDIVLAMCRHPKQAIEDFGEVGGIDAGAVILYTQADLMLVFLDVNINSSAIARVLDRIVDDII